MSRFNEKILIVEDDAQIRNFIAYALQSEGYQSVSAGNGQSALSLLVSESIDLMLLDLGLPDVDGMEVIKKVREWSELPIIVVSARDQDKEKVLALDMGVDDYLTKPFSANELLARIRVALRHFYKQGHIQSQSSIQIKALRVDFNKHLVYLENQEIHLTPMEYSLLVLFVKQAGKVLTTGFIIAEIWGVNYGNDTQALRALMASLRRKIEKNPGQPQYIQTEMGVGYRLLDE